MLHQRSWHKIVIILLTLNLSLAQVVPVLAQAESASDPAAAGLASSTYTDLMRRVNAVKKNDTSRLPVSAPRGVATPGKPVTLNNDIETIRVKTVSELEQFIKQEKDHLDTLGVSGRESRSYLKLLKKQLDAIDNRPPAWWQKMEQFFVDLFSEPDSAPTDTATPFKMPDKPASFGFTKDDVAVRTIADISVIPQPRQPLQTLLKGIKYLVTIQSINALDPIYLPTLSDTQADGEEITINAEIKDLAAALNNNPVSIFNFIRNNIAYEPYYGAKKGSVGCLHEKVCNDTDTASLTIAILRSAGIPARYKKSLILMPVEQIKNLLGVEDTRAAYAALSRGQVPVFVPTQGAGNINFNTYDFSTVTHLALEWTLPELFYEYDQRGANFPNLISFATATTTEAVRNLLGNTAFTKKQWLPMDGVVKPYDLSSATIVVDLPNANWNANLFWNNFLTLQNNISSPLQKYQSDLLARTGQDIRNNISTEIIRQQTYRLLPLSTPYLIGSASGIVPETWSVLPSVRRTQVAVALVKEANPSDVVLTQTYFGSAINNNPLEIEYAGATAGDRQIIDSYGGIHATPAALAQIVPSFHLTASGNTATGNNPVSIGEELILKFSYSLPIVSANSLFEDEKFSTAGNYEGVYITLSRVTDDPNLNTNQKILLQGGTALAREYLQRIQRDGDTLAGSLDYGYTIHFARAVVTQNRILNRVGGTPTNFDFKGLFIDAGAYISDYSQRGNYYNHRPDFRLLWGLNSSYHEANVFTAITGLNAIATVQGLQTAYGNPSTYTVHTISSSTPNYVNLVNSLNLSPNTKTNILSDIQNNNHTIITPNQPITQGNFTGQFYISLAPDYTGRYAIGEQSGGNGGWSTDAMNLNTYQNESGQVVEYASASAQSNSTFIHEDKEDFGDVNCRPDDAWRAQMETRPDWLPAFGFACTEGVAQFGNETHQYIVAGNATKFYRASNYDYWANHQTIRSQVEQYLDGLPRIDARYPYRFSSILGTYLRPSCVNTTIGKCIGDNNDIIAYYSPYQNGSDIGRVYRLSGGFLEKAGKDNNSIIALIGFPTSDEQPAAASPYGTTGVYQNFVNGQMYFYQEWGFPWVYYTYGELTRTHNQNGGTGGRLGFPENDPVTKNGFTYQKFEGDNEAGWNLQNNATAVQAFIKYRCEMYGNVTNHLTLNAISVHGVADSVGSTIEGTSAMVMAGLKDADKLLVISNPFLFSWIVVKESDKVADLLNFMSAVSVFDTKDYLVKAGSAIGQSIINELNTANCLARQNYLGGRLAGEVLQIVLPTTELTIAAKIKTLEKVNELGKAVKLLKFTKDLELVGEIGNFGKVMRVEGSLFTDWNAVKAVQGAARGSAGEAFWRQITSITESQTFQTSLGNRIVDAFDDVKNIAYEVKTYSAKVPASTFIQEEVAKDVELMNSLSNYRPVWAFIDQGPTGPLEATLQQHGIEFILLSP